MVVTPVNGHNRPRPPSPGAELYQVLVDHFKFLLTTSSELHLRSLRDPLVSLSGGEGCFGKRCLERQKAGWLDGCHGVMRKAVNAVNVVNSVQITIYPRRSEPFIGNQKQPSLFFNQNRLMVRLNILTDAPKFSILSDNAILLHDQCYVVL